VFLTGLMEVEDLSFYQAPKCRLTIQAGVEVAIELHEFLFSFFASAGCVFT